MKMQIVSCPRCGTFMLQDTAECHSCGHVIDHHSAANLKARALPTDSAVKDDMEVCPNCGESCRTGLVRCWNCSAFLRPEIEESYRRMQQSGRNRIEHVDLEILEATSVTEEDSLRRRVSTPEGFLASHAYSQMSPYGDDDFELSDDSAFGSSDDEGYDLMDDSAIASQLSDLPGVDELETVDPSVQSEAKSEGAKSIPVTSRSEVAAAGPAPLATEAVEPPAKVEGSEPPVRTDSSAPPVRATAEEPPTTEVRQAEDLIKIATDEEKDIQRVRKELRSKDTFLIFCPQGCRIRVKEKHRGMKGKCPRCQSEFVVPRKAVSKPAQGQPALEPVLASRYQKWLPEIRMHTVDPSKLRIKADSLLHECQAVDLGFAPEELLIATLIVGKWGANVKKVPPVRQAMIEHFLKQGTVETLAVAAKKVYSKDQLFQFMMAQPAPVGAESLFADIPVFGVNRIAVKLPKQADDTHAKYLSFCLSEFRAFVEAMQNVCGIDGFGTNVSVPLTEEYKKHKCHLSQSTVLELVSVNYYEKDPGFKLETSGWRCAACGIVVSEAARVEAKLGGANGKGIAKAKCPKCSQKFGTVPLFQLAGATAVQPVEQPAAETEAAMA